jgi:hypothetical protein
MKDVYQQIEAKDKRKRDKPKHKYPMICEECLYVYDAVYDYCPRCYYKEIEKYAKIP